jgi:hypothetical protein
MNIQLNICSEHFYRLVRPTELCARFASSPAMPFRSGRTGSLAVEIHHLPLGPQPSVRVLNDLDFIADSFN